MKGENFMIQAINPIQNTKARTFMSAPQAETKIQLPAQKRNYTLFDQKKVDSLVAQREQALPYIKSVLANSQDEKQIIEALYITDRLAESGVKGIPAMYPLLSKFNNSNSPDIQVFLAGIYRKTQVPDAFGPLVAMLVKNSSAQTPNAPFDPNEEIGGAILAYIENYSHNPPKIDYSA